MSENDVQILAAKMDAGFEKTAKNRRI